MHLGSQLPSSSNPLSPAARFSSSRTVCVYRTIARCIFQDYVCLRGNSPGLPFMFLSLKPVSAADFVDLFSRTLAWGGLDPTTSNLIVPRCSDSCFINGKSMDVIQQMGRQKIASIVQIHTDQYCHHQSCVALVDLLYLLPQPMAGKLSAGWSSMNVSRGYMLLAVCHVNVIVVPSYHTIGFL